MTIEAGTVRPPRRSPKKSRWRSNLLIAALVFLLAATGIGLWTTQNYIWRIPASTHNSPQRALLLDELALTYPDPSFVSNTTQALTAGGYSVTYIGPSPNAVDFFRQLPAKGYDLVIIRAHQGGGQSIITTQLYSQSQYVTDQLSGRLAAAEASGGSMYFAITSNFVRQDMQGRFQGTTVIVMGCAALQGTQDLASAFLDKGAEFFVGWDGTVTIIHTDTSTVSLARQISGGTTVPEATRIAGSADPVYGARLVYLDWGTLVNERVNDLVSQITLWSFLGAMLVLGPFAVFIVPKLFSMFGRAGQMFPRRKRNQSKTERST